jgi:hypothetical protein
MTPQQLAVLDFIRNRLEETGVAPTYDEIMQRFGFASRSRAHRCVGALIQAGKLKRRAHSPRGLSLPNASLTGVPTGALAAELMRRQAEAPVAVVQFTAEDRMRMSIFGKGPMRFLVIDERCPGDRVYEITTRLPIDQLAELVSPEEPIGTKDDERHGALVGLVAAAARGERHLRSVE